MLVAVCTIVDRVAFSNCCDEEKEKKKEKEDKYALQAVNGGVKAHENGAVNGVVAYNGGEKAYENGAYVHDGNEKMSMANGDLEGECGQL